MNKLFIALNVTGTLALAAIGPVPATAAEVVRSPVGAQVVLAQYVIEQQAPVFADAFLSLNQTDRDRVLFRLADERSMRMWAQMQAQKPTGPMDAR